MTLTTIQVLQEASGFGVKLGVEPPDTLTVEPVERCPKDFVPVLKARKSALLALLRLPFVMVFSEILGEMLFFAEDEDTRAALVEAGVEPSRQGLSLSAATSQIAPPR
jgi:hypothetical protein